MLKSLDVGRLVLDRVAGIRLGKLSFFCAHPSAGIGAIGCIEVVRVVTRTGNIRHCRANARDEAEHCNVRAQDCDAFSKAWILVHKPYRNVSAARLALLVNAADSAHCDDYRVSHCNGLQSRTASAILLDFCLSLQQRTS